FYGAFQMATPKKKATPEKTTTPEKKVQRAEPEQSNGPRGEIVKIYYAEDETGPAELLGESLARIIDVPALTDDFWRDDIVRLAAPSGEGFPRIAEVIFTRYARRSSVRFYGGEFAAALIMNMLNLLNCDAAVIVPSVEGKSGLISVAHPDCIDPADVV